MKVLGGTIFGAPFDVGTNGRMAIVKDPQGATLCLWEARAHPGAQIVGEIGTLVLDRARDDRHRTPRATSTRASSAGR